MRDYRLYLKDILAALESIETFMEGMGFEEFRADDKTASAVQKIRNHWRSDQKYSRGYPAAKTKTPFLKRRWGFAFAA